MKVIIPAAGIGQRLQPHTLTTPKPLLKVGGKAILDYLLLPLEDLQPDEVIFVIGYKGEMIEEYVRANFSFKSTFIKQDKLLGLGYAVLMAMKNMDNSELLVLLGDTIVECNLSEFVNAGDYALGLHKVDDPRRFGVAEVIDNVIVNLEEKPDNPKSDLALIGLYYFSQSDSLKAELSNLISSGKTTSGEIQLTDALDIMIKNGIKFSPYQIEAWFDCGKKETMLETNQHILNKQSESPQISGSKIIHPVYISEKVKVENSTIGPYVAVDKETEILNSIISNSIIGGETKIINSEFKDSIIGDKAIVENVKNEKLNIGYAAKVINNILKDSN